MSTTKPTLQISFEGVCAFVPNDPFFKQKSPGKWKAGKPTELSVLVPDMTSPALASWDQHTVGAASVVRTPHLPLVSFLMSSFDERNNSRLPDLVVRKGNSREELGVIFLDGYHVHLGDGLDKSRPLTFESKIYTSQAPKKDQRRSLWWLPRMSEISPSDSIARASLYFTGTPGLDESGLKASAIFNNGHLSVDGFNVDINDDPQVWPFSAMKWDKKSNTYISSGKPTLERAIGNRVVLEIGMTAECAEINFSQNVNDQFTLCLRHSPWTGVATLRIMNAEPEVALALASEAILPLGRGNSGDPDFEALYLLSAGRQLRDIGLGGRKNIVPTLNSPQIIGNSARPCAPVAFDGFEVI